MCASVSNPLYIIDWHGIKIFRVLADSFQFSPFFFLSGGENLCVDFIDFKFKTLKIAGDGDASMVFFLEIFLSFAQNY